MAGVRFPDGASLQIPASVAQLAARGSHNPKVVGSKPTGGILIAYQKLLWRSWQRIGLMSRWSRVRAPAGAAFLLNARSKIVTEVGFEPTPPKRLVPKTSALDHSAIQPFDMITKTNKLHPPGIEPGTYCVLGSRHNQLDHGCAEHPRRDSNPQSRDS